MKQKKAKIFPLCCLCLGLLLLGGAGGLLIHNMQEESTAQATATSVLQAVDEKFTLQKAAEEVQMAKLETPAQALAIPLETINPLTEMPIMIVDGIPYVGVIAVPSLNLELPVIHQWSDQNLKIAPCLYTGSVYHDNMVIAGHNYTSHFAKLGNVTPGDSVHFIDMDQNIFHFTVAELELIDPTGIEEMTTPDTWDLTLFTCSYDGNVRIAVRCTLDPEEF